MFQRIEQKALKVASTLVQQILLTESEVGLVC
jgi:hypothetical protein